jgi:hypothetical protein
MVARTDVRAEAWADYAAHLINLKPDEILEAHEAFMAGWAARGADNVKKVEPQQDRKTR